jgi:hypothetical protein
LWLGDTPYGAFGGCTSLVTVTLGNSVTNIGDFAFIGCSSLATVTIGNNVTTIGDGAFEYCTSLTSVHFQGNAPSLGEGVFYDTPATNYYLPGTTGWGTNFGGRPTALWHLPTPTILTLPPNFGLKTNHLAFRISWATNASVVVDAASSLADPAWIPIATNTIATGIDQATDGWADFTDPDPAAHPARFYRVRSP